MSLLPHSATFHELVQDCFVTYRGRGVSLSSADLELLELWASAGVPVEVVIRGIRKAAEDALWDAPPEENNLRSLLACQRKVNNEIEKYMRVSVGSAEGTKLSNFNNLQSFHLVRHKKLLLALKHVQKNNRELSPLIAKLKTLPPPVDFTAANRHEELVLATLLRAFPYTERLSLLRKATLLMEKTKVQSRSARHELRRFHRATLVRCRLRMPAFW